MEEPGLDGISDSELEILGNFLNQTHDIYRRSVVQVLTSDEDWSGGGSLFGAGIGDILYYLSDDMSDVDRQVFRLDTMRRSLDELMNSSFPEREVPDDAKITPEILKALAIHSELTSYFSHIGFLLEEFSTELILEEVVDKDRRSNRVKRDIEQKSQWEREWLMFVTGVIDSGEKDNIRTVYQRRNDLVHGVTDFEELSDMDILSDEMLLAWETVDSLHEKLFGIPLQYRMSEILIGNSSLDLS